MNNTTLVKKKNRKNEKRKNLIFERAHQVMKDQNPTLLFCWRKNYRVNTHTDCRTMVHIIQNTTMYDDNNNNTHKNWI